MIAAAAPRRAAALTAGVLAAAAVRGLLQPIGDLPAAVGFVVVMFAVLRAAGGAPTLTLPRQQGKGSLLAQPPPSPSPASGGGTVAALASPASGGGISLVAGVAMGLVLLLPVIGAGWSGRSLDGFWGWGAAVVVVATLEEIVIRGRLQPAWTAEAGPLVGLLASATVFAVIHLPRYGVSAMPLDFSVGLALAGLRAVTGRVAPCAIAHVIADWGAWFWL